MISILSGTPVRRTRDPAAQRGRDRDGGIQLGGICRINSDPKPESTGHGKVFSRFRSGIKPAGLPVVFPGLTCHWIPGGRHHLLTEAPARRDQVFGLMDREFEFPSGTTR